MIVLQAGLAWSCASGDRASPGRQTDSTLAAELERRGARDQEARAAWMAALQRGEAPDSADFVRTVAIDRENTEWLRVVVREQGWPGVSRVGAAAAGAAFLIVQHSPDTVFQRRMLAVIEQAVATGDATGQEFALLFDRVAMNAGRPQRFGTQASLEDGRVVLHPIEDSATVDERRAELGMMPLAEYVHLLDSSYTSGRAH